MKSLSKVYNRFLYFLIVYNHIVKYFTLKYFYEYRLRLLNKYYKDILS